MGMIAHPDKAFAATSRRHCTNVAATSASIGKGWRGSTCIGGAEMHLHVCGGGSTISKKWLVYRLGNLCRLVVEAV
jgi:hypothetical protein